MLNKSKIKIINEKGNMRRKFLNEVEELLNRCIVEDAIFFNDNGSMKEYKTGYWKQTDAYTTLDEAVGCMESGMGIRIKDGVYYIGCYYNKLSDIPKDGEMMNESGPLAHSIIDLNKSMEI